MFAKLGRITWKASLLAMLKALLSFSVVLAASGGLDLTFSGDGLQTTKVNSARPFWDDQAFGSVRQPDGKIVAVGFTTDYQTDANFALARYNVNGSLDPTFSGDGKLLTNLGGWDYAYGVALQSNGKLVLSGHSCNGKPGASTTICKLAVVRYNADGTFDTTFNSTGRRLTSWQGLNTQSLGGVAIQTDGKIVLSAVVPDGTVYDLAVFRLNSNGSTDTTFNGSGMQRISFGAGIGSSADYGRNLAIQKDGKIVLSGGTKNYFALVRLNPSGSLDTTFSGDGKLITDFGGLAYSAALAIQPDGKIVAIGTKYVMSGNTIVNSYMALARYNVNGSLDLSFNGSGKKVIEFAAGNTTYDYGKSVIVLSTGKIVVAGEAFPGGFTLARLSSNGSLDTTFSGDGKVMYDIGSSRDGCNALYVDGMGRYVLVGAARLGTEYSYNFALMRILP